nr:PREDICTED: 39S ribosomal protein L32, mitochondrial isoform X2 [Rhinolophus sinicus]
MGLPDSASVRTLGVRAGFSSRGKSGLREKKMAAAMLLLVFPPWPTAPGLLRNCWERLRRKMQQSRPGFPCLPWGPALAVQGPATITEPANDNNGSKEISSLLDSIFWMAAPKNRRSIEVNRCRRRNPQKLIKVKDEETEAKNLHVGAQLLSGGARI